MLLPACSRRSFANFLPASSRATCTCAFCLSSVSRLLNTAPEVIPPNSNHFADFVDPQERITELSQLIAALPIANYSLLRALTAHLILIVQNAHVNKMTMRNVGIVFSPTLGIPAGVFSLMLGEFKCVFNVDGALDEDAPVAQGEDAERDEFRRNSKRYSDAAADELLGLSGRTLTGA